MEVVEVQPPQSSMALSSPADWSSSGSDASSSPRCPWEEKSTGARSKTSNNSQSTAASKRIQGMSLQEFNDNYRIDKQVIMPGLSGPFGTFVHYATRKSDQEQVVVKVVNKALAFEGCVRDELEWLKKMKAQLSWPKSEAVCELTELIQTDTHYYAIMEKFDGQDSLAWRSRSKVHFRHSMVRSILKQLLQAAQALHGAGLVCRDLKLETVMVSVEPEKETNSGSQVSVKLVDLDAVTTCAKSGARERYVIGSHGYNAPEAYQGFYSTASDMYSIGVIMYKLLTRRFPVCPHTFDVKLGEEWVGSPSMKQIFKQLQGKRIDFSGSPFDECPAAASLCAALLAARPEDRPSADSALSHQWFTLDGDLPDY